LKKAGTRRIAAILMLAGWYFVVAPYQKPDAPMGKWEVDDRSDTESDCQLYKNSLALAVSNAMKTKGQTQPDETQARLLAGECV
jgi:hypothetical protein